MTNLSIYLYICTIFVMLLFEVWGLRCVSYDMIWNNFPQMDMESYHPLFTSARLHCRVILPVNINTIKIILKNKITKFFRTLSRVNFSSCRKLSTTKSTNHQFDPIIIIFFLNIFLYLIFICSKYWTIPHKGNRIRPYLHNINRTTWICPKCENKIIVYCRLSITRYTHACCYWLRWPPYRYSVNVR